MVFNDPAKFEALLSYFKERKPYGWIAKEFGVGYHSIAYLAARLGLDYYSKRSFPQLNMGKCREHTISLGRPRGRPIGAKTATITDKTNFNNRTYMDYVRAEEERTGRKIYLPRLNKNDRFQTAGEFVF